MGMNSKEMKLEEAKPRLNQRSLKQMAKRHRTCISASAYRSHTLHFLSHYLTHCINELESKDCHPHELFDWEKDLEAIEAALIHLWIALPYNDVLFIPERLPDAMIARINTMARKSKIRSRHLRLAYSAAA